MMEEIIRLENVVKMYGEGIRAINGIDLSIKQGECLVIYGPPGSGKTTLSRLIAGIEKPSAGKITVLGESLHDMSSDRAALFRNKNIALLHKNPEFLNNLTVLENTAIPLMLRGESTDKREKIAKEQLKTLGLKNTAYARPNQLSRIEKHKAAIARAMTVRPKVILLDDFTSGLKEESEIVKTLLEIYNREGCTIIEFTGSDKGFISGDRIATLMHGKFQEEQK